MKKSIAAIGFILALGFSPNLMAQEGKLWNLKECVDYAYQHNISIRTQENTVQTNKNNQFQSKMNLLPGASASASQSYSGGGRSIDPFTNTVVVGQTFRSNSFSVGANWALFRGFQNINSLSQSALTTKASEFDVETQKNTISLNIVSAYVNMLAGYEQVIVAQEQLKLTQAQVDRTQKLVNAGSSAEVNLLNLKAQLATDELSLITAENALDLARLQIQQLMQKPVEQGFNIERPQLEVPNSTSLLESPQQIYQTAEKGLPQIKAAETRIVSANKQIQITKGGFSPTLDMTFGYFTNYSGLASRYVVNGVEERQSQYYYRDGNNNVVPVYQLAAIGKTESIGLNSQFKDNIRQSLSFNLNIPIFSNWQNHTNLSNAKIQRYNAELNAQTTKNTLRQEVEQAWLDARTASKRFESTQKQVQSLKEALRANEQRLNVGAINSVDYNQSKTNLAKAASELVRAKYDLVLRIKLLDFYLGKGLDLN